MTSEEAKKHLEILRDILVGFEQGYHIAPSQKRIDACKTIIKALEQEPQTFKWCTDCKEYDQEKHCCHRWSKVIRDTVDEMKQEYIEREVLDKIRAEITTLQNRCYALTKGTMCVFCKYECKYKVESEIDNGND